MQEYYNQISKQKRIAFIDNLTDSKAKTISAQYPFAICFANKDINNEDLDYPVIWYNGKRYGYTNVDTSLITIGDISIGLNVDENGVLGLSYQHDLIYIGPNTNNYNSNEEYIIQLSGLTTIPNLNNIESKWYLIKDYNFNEENIEINSDTIIILPANYGLYLPFYNDPDITQINEDMKDPMWIADNENIIINNKQYKIYRYNTEYSDYKLLSVVKKININ